MHYLVCEGTSTDIDSLQRVSNTCNIHIYFSFMYYNNNVWYKDLNVKNTLHVVVFIAEFLFVSSHLIYPLHLYVSRKEKKLTLTMHILLTYPVVSPLNCMACC